MRIALRVVACVLALSSPYVASAAVVVGGGSQIICKMPVTPNDGNVIGYDGGLSTRFGSFTYWFFGDALRRLNNETDDWEIDGLVEGIVPQGMHMGKTFDTAPSGCFTGFNYKNGADGRIGPALSNIAGECVVWPAGAVGTASGKLYTYFHAFGQCNGTTERGTGLAQITDLNDMTVQRIGGGYTFLPFTTTAGKRMWGNPILISYDSACGTLHDVFVFGTVHVGNDVWLARVSSANIEDRTKYTFWDGTAFTPDDDATKDGDHAVPIFTSGIDTENQMSVAFNEHLNRYVAIYSCAYSTQICMQYTLNQGRHPNRLVQGWSAVQTLFNCPDGTAYRCKQANQHPSSAVGDKIYVTTSRHSAPGNPEHPEYRLELREFTLNWQ
jgi:hypothetical protein